jgi:hypothetical protein
LEYLFRAKSRYLNTSGQIVKSIPAQLREKLGGKPRDWRKGRRINQIDQAWTLYLYRNSSWLAKRLRRLERLISLSARLAQVRHPAVHGLFGDSAFECKIYALLVAMYYYAEHLTND